MSRSVRETTNISRQTTDISLETTDIRQETASGAKEIIRKNLRVTGKTVNKTANKTTKKTTDRINELLLKLYQTNNLEREELLTVLTGIDSESKELLFDLARKTRHRYYGDKVYLRAIVEFSNYCKNTCKYCGLRAPNKKVSRYRIPQGKILECCEMGYALGYRTFVLQSGEDSYFDDDKLTEIARSIKDRFKDAALTFSVGERSIESYKRLKDAGVDRYLLRHETINPRLYEKLHPGMSLENRIRCLHTLKELGFQAGAGFIVGLPGQDDESIADDILFLKDLSPHMIGIGPFIAHPDTPLGNERDGDVEKTLLCLALIRLFLPHVLLPATTALAVLHPQGFIKGLYAGANVIMANLTPLVERGKYEIYRNRNKAGDDADMYTKKIRESIAVAGLQVSMGRGNHVSIDSGQADSAEGLNGSGTEQSGCGSQPAGPDAVKANCGTRLSSCSACPAGINIGQGGNNVCPAGSAERRVL